MSRIDALLQTRKPAIFVMGSMNAGKSTLINAIFDRGKIVPQSYRRMTARFIRLTYSPEPFVAHMYCGKCVKLRYEQTVHQPEVEYNFKTFDSDLKTEIVVGVNHAILNRGFDIIDTPLYDCNETMNATIMKKVESERPLILYVVNGSKGLLSTDVDQLSLLKRLNLQIVYYTSKLTFNYGTVMTLDIATHRAQSVFNRLIDCELLLTNMLDCAPLVHSYLYTLIAKSDMTHCPFFFYCDKMNPSNTIKSEVDVFLSEQWTRFMHWLTILTV